MWSSRWNENWELAGEIELLGESLPQCHFVHYESHMTWAARIRAAAVGSRRLTASFHLIQGSRKLVILYPSNSHIQGDSGGVTATYGAHF
jgi:hypothetical protein